MSLQNNKGQGNENKFNFIDGLSFPKGLQDAILSDLEIQNIVSQLAPLSAKYYSRVEELRKQFGFSYNDISSNVQNQNLNTQHPDLLD